MPIRYDLDDVSMKNILMKVNGILIPGHDDNVLTPDHDLTIATKAVFKILDIANEIRKKTGQKIPVFGICLGMQQIVAYECHKNNVEPRDCLDIFQVYATNLPLIPSE